MSVKKFNIENLMKYISKTNCYINILGHTNSGKSVLLDYLFVKIHKLFDSHILFSRTIFTGNYKHFESKKSLFFEDFSEIVLRSVYEFQKMKIEDGEEKNRILLLFDDTVDSSMFHSKIMQSIIFNHRHLNITLIFCSQTPRMIHPAIKEQARYLFIMHCFGKSRKNIVENYLDSLFDDTSYINNTLKKVHEIDYTSAVVDLTVNPRNIDIQSFKADINTVNKFKLKKKREREKK